MSKKRHTAIIEWNGWSWIATPDVGGVTEADRLSVMRTRLSEVARLTTGKKIHPDDWTLLIHFAGNQDEEAATVRGFRAQVEAEEERRARVSAQGP